MTDCIMIGGGHNGLVCATYLAKAGHKVTVLEANEQVGGLATTREFAPGFKASMAHLLYLLDDGIAKELGIKVPLAQSGLDTVSLDTGGNHVRISGAQVEGVSADDQTAMAEYHRLMSRFAGIIGGLNNRIPPRMGTTDRGDLVELAKLGLGIRRLGKDDMREFLRIAGINVHDILEEKFDSDLLKGALSLDGTLGTFLGTRSNNSVFCAMHRMSNGGKYAIPKGGMGAVTEAMADAARQAGVTIRTGARVKDILVDLDKVTGVRLDNGEELSAGTIVSNADPRTTLLGMLGARHLEAGLSHRINHIRHRGCVAKLHLALSDLPDFTGLDSAGMGQRLVIAPDLQYVDHAFNHAKYGEHSAQPVAEITLPSLHDDSLAPAGQHVLSANVQWAPHDLKAGWSTAKEAFTETVIGVIERYAPDLRSKILHTEMLTAADIATDYNVAGGHWHHAELTLDQSMMMRPAYGVAQYGTPVDGLWLCGAGSHPGGGVMGSAGRNAARAVLDAKG